MGNVPPEMSLGSFPSAITPALISLPVVSQRHKSIQTDSEPTQSEMRRYPSPGAVLTLQGEALEMVRVEEQKGDRESKLTHSGATERSSGDQSKSRIHAEDWSLLDTAEAHLTKRNAMAFGKDSVGSPSLHSAITSHTREKSDSALLSSALVPPPRHESRFSVEDTNPSEKKALLWTKPAATACKQPTEQRKRQKLKPKSETPKALTIQLTKEMRSSPSLHVKPKLETTKSAQSPINSGVSSVSHSRKTVRNSCSALSLPKRVTVSLKDVSTPRRLTVGSMEKVKMIRVELEDAGARHRKTGENPATDSTTNNSLAAKGASARDAGWCRPRGASPSLHDLELVEKETIRRQFGKPLASSREYNLLRYFPLSSLSKSPKGNLVRSPKAQNRYEVAAAPQEEMRGFEVVPATLNLSEIAKKENQSGSVDREPQKTSGRHCARQQDWSVPM